MLTVNKTNSVSNMYKNFINYLLLTIVCCGTSIPAQTSVVVSSGASGALPCLVAVACEIGCLGRHVWMVST